MPAESKLRRQCGIGPGLQEVSVRRSWIATLLLVPTTYQSLHRSRLKRSLLDPLCLFLGLSGCSFVGSAAQDVPRAIKESSRVDEVSKWQGTYTFSECAPSASASSSTPICWTYQVVVNGDGDAMGTLRADGPELS